MRMPGKPCASSSRLLATNTPCYDIRVLLEKQWAGSLARVPGPYGCLPIRSLRSGMRNTASMLQTQHPAIRSVAPGLRRFRFQSVECLRPATCAEQMPALSIPDNGRPIRWKEWPAQPVRGRKLDAWSKGDTLPLASSRGAEKSLGGSDGVNVRAGRKAGTTEYTARKRPASSAASEGLTPRPEGGNGTAMRQG